MCLGNLTDREERPLLHDAAEKPVTPKPTIHQQQVVLVQMIHQLFGHCFLGYAFGTDDEAVGDACQRKLKHHHPGLGNATSAATFSGAEMLG